ncbi:MAG TPA: biotin transporter BioY [Vicinamibacterales bacterium]|nr:biotin transporter BioY [Vicinamibacterales bacterium]
MTVRTADSTLIAAVAPRAIDQRLVRAGATVALTLLTAAAAQISVPLPFTPVPLTLQPMVVLLGAAVMGARLGASSQVLYLALGAAGLPVFAASPILPQGALRLLGPTGGYLLAYPLAAFVAGYLAERGFDRRYATSLLAMAAGLAIVFASGVAWLAAFATPAAGFDAAMRAGFWPFIGADLVKLALAAAILPTVWRFLTPAAS